MEPTDDDAEIFDRFNKASLIAVGLCQPTKTEADCVADLNKLWDRLDMNYGKGIDIRAFYARYCEARERERAFAASFPEAGGYEWSPIQQRLLRRICYT